MTRREDGRYVETVTLKNGKRKYFYGKTQAEVRRKIREYDEVKDLAPTFGEVAADWAREFEPTVSHKTMSVYSPALERILEDFSDVEITKIEPVDIQNFISKLKSMGYSQKYIKNHKTVFIKVFDREIMKKGASIKVNPAISAKIPKNTQPKKIHAATPEQETVIKKSVSAPFGLYAFLLLYTGCRSQEALALQWADIDFEADTVSVNKAVTYPHNQAVIKETKTESSVRMIPLLAPLKRELMKARPDPYNEDLYLFGSERPYSQQEYVRRWRQYALTVGFLEEYFVDVNGNRLETLSELQRIPHKKVRKTTLTPHQLRHSFATMCFEAELSPEDAQKFLGHSDIKTTVNIYTDIRAAKQKAAANKLNAFVGRSEQ